ncbi:MAG: TCP-1/cpn60 chaperonin family protein [Oscillospiraceae bacterium]|nr:TCP-1/cpn60 chaperonin family protein [Oscillospiraceae bacterium]
MANDVVLRDELADKILAGSEKVRRTVEANYGPLGYNSIRDQKYDLPLIANTGRHVLQELSLEDPVENISAVMVRDAALNVAAECGDGSIATVIMTDALLAEGMKMIAAGYGPVDLQRGARLALADAINAIPEITVPFEDIDCEKYAMAAAKNEEVAQNVIKAFQMVGKDGIINVQDTQRRETVLNEWDGARYDYGLMSMAFINDEVKRCCVLDEPYVLLSNVKISSVQDIRKVLEDTSRSGVSLLIIASDITQDVMNVLTANAARGLKVAAAKAPGFGDTRRRNMLALAAMVGSLMFDENTGREIKDCGLEVCSRIGQAVIDKETTVLQGFRDTSREMSDILRHHVLLRLETEKDKDEREKLMETLSILDGKSAEILVGGTVEYEMFEKKYLYENTVRSMQNAAKTGVVPGAGNAFVYLARKIEEKSADLPESEMQGARCLCRALQAIVRALAENAGEDGGVVLGSFDIEKDPWRGYDVLQKKMTDLKEAGILMPKSTVETILDVSVSTALSLWTAEAAVFQLNPDKKQN